MQKLFFPYLLLVLSALGLAACSPSASAVTEPPSVPEGSSPPPVIYRSLDQGRSWLPLQADLPSGAQVSFMEPLGSEMVVATDNKGLYLSTNQMQGWKPINEGLPNPKINSLYTQDGAIWAGVYNEGLFYRAADSSSWTPLNETLPNLRVQSVLMDKTLLAGTDIGIFSMNPGRQQWEPVLKGVQVLSLERLGTWLIAGTSQGTYRSGNDGQSWHSIHNEGAVHYTHVVGDKIVEFYLTGDLYLSDDQGESFYLAPYHPREASYVYEMIGMGDTLIMSNNYGIHQSLDQGHSWRLVYPEESVGFFDFMVSDGLLYGGTRLWDEYRGR